VVGGVFQKSIELGAAGVESWQAPVPSAMVAMPFMKSKKAKS